MQTRFSLHGPRGFTLVELLVSMTLGLLIVLGLGWVFLNSTRSNTELAKMSQQMDNGRFATYLLNEDLMHAGFWGEMSSIPSPGTPAGFSPCKSYVDWLPEDKQYVLGVPIEGYVDGTGLHSSCDILLANRKEGTDVLVVRHAATCTPGTVDCANGVLAIQASLCSSDTASWVMEPSGSTALTLRRPDSANRPCTHPSYVTTTAPKRRVMSNIYYIREYAKHPGDNIPTLMVAEPDGSDARPLVEGIEYFQVEYGIDNVDNDGTPDSYVHDTTAMTLDTWTKVVAVKVYLIARNLEPTPGYTDTKIYTLPGGNVGPFNDDYKRHAYQITVRLTNVSGRRRS